MIDITRLNPSKITPDGYYFDMENVNMFPLSDEEIKTIREYFHNPNIAFNRTMKVTTNTKYKVSSNQKYNNGRNRARKNNKKLQNGIVKMVAVGSLMVAVTVCATNLIQNYEAVDDLQETSAYYQIETNQSNAPLLEVERLAYQSDDFEEEIRADLIDFYCEQYGLDFQSVYNQILTITNNFMSEDYQNRKIMIGQNIVSGGTESELLSGLVSALSSLNIVEEDSIQKEWVRKYCDIYQVNFNIVYNRLVELTDNFTNENYLNGCIPGVTCKQEPVYASSEEELILYFVRCAKQLPSQLGIEKENLYIQNGYQSPLEYGHSIGHFGNVLGVDPFLMYAIVQSETSWNSPLFMDSNNPAGLQNNGNWWTFSTKEEGFIELALEILKYNRKGAFTIEEIGSIHAPTIDPANANWVSNVTQVYQDVSLNHRDFVLEEENNSYYR